MTRLELRHFPQEKPNGDRATTKTKCHRYELVVVSAKGEATVDTADDFDSYHTYVDDRGTARNELRAKASKLAEAFDVQWTEVMMKEEVVTVRKWLPESTIR